MTDKEGDAFHVILSVSEGSYAGCTCNILEPEWYEKIKSMIQ